MGTQKIRSPTANYHRELISSITKKFQRFPEFDKLKFEFTNENINPCEWHTIEIVQEQTNLESRLEEQLIRNTARRLLFPGRVENYLEVAFGVWMEGVPDFGPLSDFICDLVNAVDITKSDLEKLLPTDLRADLKTELLSLIATRPFVLWGVQRAVELLRPTSWKEKAILSAPFSFSMSTDQLDMLFRTLVADNATPTDISRFLEVAPVFLDSSLRPLGIMRELDNFAKSSIKKLRGHMTRDVKWSRNELANLLYGEYIAIFKTYENRMPKPEEVRSYENFITDLAVTLTKETLNLTGWERRWVLKGSMTLNLHNTFLQLVARSRGSRKNASKPVEPWNFGDDFRWISFLDTFRSFGMFIPTITALKRKEPTTGKRSKAIAICMDVSGSMAYRNRLSLETEVAYCILEGARTGMDTVTLVPFSGTVEEDNFVLHSKDYDLLEDIILSIEPNGGSNLASALEAAYRSALMAGSQDNFILTDGELWDFENSRGLLVQLAKYGTNTLFLVGSAREIKEEVRKGLLSPELKSEVYDCDLRDPAASEAVVNYISKAELKI